MTVRHIRDFLGTEPLCQAPAALSDLSFWHMPPPGSTTTTSHQSTFEVCPQCVSEGLQVQTRRLVLPSSVHHRPESLSLMLPRPLQIVALHVHPECVRHFGLSSLRCGGREQFNAEGPVMCSVFAEGSAVLMFFDRMVANETLEMTVLNFSDKPMHFKCKLIEATP